MPQSFTPKSFVPDSFVPDTFKPDSFTPDPAPQQPQNVFQQGYDLLNNPIFDTNLPQGGIMDVPGALLDIGRNLWNDPRSIAPMAKGYLEGAFEGVKSLLSPINIADAATGFGKAPALRAINKGVSALTAAGGVHDIAQGNTPLGIAEIAGGALGFVPRNIAAPAKPQQPIAALPAIGETFKEPRFFGGVAGVADNNMQYPGRLGHEAIVPDIGPMDAASRMIEDIPFKHPRGPLAPTPKAQPMTIDATPIRVESSPIVPSAEAKMAAQQGDKINWANELFNLPRALKSSFDLSAPFRQGFSLSARPEFWRSWDDMIKAWGSKDAFEAVEKSILTDKFWKLGKESGLRLTEVSGPISKREEDFMSVIANKLPGVKQSNRSYSAFLNKLRQDTFSSLINDAEKVGLKPVENKLLTNAIAKFVNHATGRGDLRTKIPGGLEIDLEKNAVLLNNLFFSPRLIKSRLHMLNPANYLQIGKEYGMNSPEAKFMRKQYLKSTIPLVTAGATMMSLGAMGLGEVEIDPRSSDFGKLKIGNTRLDPYGGHQQYGTLLARLVTGQSKSTSSNNVFNLGESPVKPSMAELFMDFSSSPNRGFIGNKLHPTIAFGMDWAKLHNQQGYEIPPRVIELFAPMIGQDLLELAQEDPMLIPMLGPLAATGMGVQTY